MSAVESHVTEAPAWLADMEFCHVLASDGRHRMCGSPVAAIPKCQGWYDGEAICPYCGHPTCPRCAQLAELEDVLEDE